jgi:cytoskeletal protein CcmA (bactofilin family)
MANEGQIDSVIGKQTLINGDVNVKGSTKIDGSVNGSVTVKENLIIGKDATVQGDIHCKSAIIGGRIEGNITAEELIEFQSSAHMLGDVVCKGLTVEQGVFFEGNCRMSQKAKEKE